MLCRKKVCFCLLWGFLWFSVQSSCSKNSLCCNELDFSVRVHFHQGEQWRLLGGLQRVALHRRTSCIYLKAIHGFIMDSRAFVFAKSLSVNSSMIHSQIIVASYYHGHFNSKVHKRLSSDVRWHQWACTHFFHLLESD